jgi:HAD superfamily hydrolase (TIGR01450 family)
MSKPAAAKPDPRSAERNSRAATSLRTALAGVRAFVLDADGVLLYRGAAIPGSVAALETLHERKIPYRVVTNFSMTHRSTLAATFSKLTGLPPEPDRIITAASAAAAYTATRHPGARLLVLASPDALREWEGQETLTVEEADAPGAEVDAVVIGDAGDALSFGNLNIAFRHLRAGAAFIAMHRNPWWVTERGPTLDSGALVIGLEHALGRRAVICGKPSPIVFREALDELRGEIARSSGARLRTAEVAMVGDDPKADVAAARRVGLRGILVLSGKVTSEAEAGGVRADAVARDLAEVVAALA